MAAATLVSTLMIACVRVFTAQHLRMDHMGKRQVVDVLRLTQSMQTAIGPSRALADSRRLQACFRLGKLQWIYHRLVRWQCQGLFGRGPGTLWL